MIPQFKGLDHPLGSQKHTETVLGIDSIGTVVRRIQNEYSGGHWRTCLHRCCIGQVYDRRGDERLWLIRLEMDVPTQPVIRLMAVHVNEIAFITDPGESDGSDDHQ